MNPLPVHGGTEVIVSNRDGSSPQLVVGCPSVSSHDAVVLYSLLLKITFKMNNKNLQGI